MRKKSVLAVLALSALPLTAEAQQTQEHRVTLAPDDKPVSIKIDKYEPSSGELAAVRIEIYAEVQGKLALENLAGSNQTALAQASFGAAVFGLNDDILMFSSGEASRVQRLPSFDGQLDFAGDSSRTFGFEEQTAIKTLELNQSNYDLSSLVQRNGELQSIELEAQLVASEQVLGAPDIATRLQAEAELTVRVTFLIVHPIDDGPVIVPNEPGKDRNESLASSAGVIAAADEPRNATLKK